MEIAGRVFPEGFLLLAVILEEASGISRDVENNDAMRSVSNEECRLVRHKGNHPKATDYDAEKQRRRLPLR